MENNSVWDTASEDDVKKAVRIDEEMWSAGSVSDDDYEWMIENGFWKY